MSALGSHRLICVVWTDAASDTGWTTISDARRYEHWQARSLTRTVGHLLADLPEGIVVGPSVTDDGEMVADALFVPRGVIQRVTEVMELERAVDSSSKRKEQAVSDYDYQMAGVPDE